MTSKAETDLFPGHPGQAQGPGRRYRVAQVAGFARRSGVIASGQQSATVLKRGGTV